MSKQPRYEAAANGEVYFTIEILGDGRIMVTLGDPDYFVCLTPAEWQTAVKAITPVEVDMSEEADDRRWRVVTAQDFVGEFGGTGPGLWQGGHSWPLWLSQELHVQQIVNQLNADRDAIQVLYPRVTALEAALGKVLDHVYLHAFMDEETVKEIWRVYRERPSAETAGVEAAGHPAEAPANPDR